VPSAADHREIGAHRGRYESAPLAEDQRSAEVQSSVGRGTHPGLGAIPGETGSPVGTHRGDDKLGARSVPGAVVGGHLISDIPPSRWNG
jgi:hypothetical protein